MKTCCTPSQKKKNADQPTPSHAKALIAIKKSRGMLDNIEKLIQEQAYCADISQQVNAVIGMMQQLNITILKDHLLSCGVRELSSAEGEQMQAFVDELVRVWGIGNRK
ncbi:MAG: metal-sensing transcriptional repressor [Candidatus Peribacteria bacterium]|jgi:DNA-binding FrmR family transcriptional regulator|nr:metal-sensing transcriptional repressor [Candidatus Peribacteria bacterium]